MSVRFDSATDRISYAGSPPDPAAGITMAGWVYVVAANGEGNQTFARVHAASGGSTSITFATDGNPPAGPGYFTGGGSIVSGTQCPVGEWRYVAVTCTGTDGTLYAAEPEGAFDVDTGTVAGAASPTGITIGGRSPVDGSEWGNIRAAYWRLWSDVLDDTELAAEKASAAPVRIADLWADWPLEVHTDLTDHSGNGRHLVAGSTATTTEDGPPLAADEVTGSGASTSPAAEASGVGAVVVAGAGASSPSAAAGAGAGTVVVTGIGAAAAPAGVASGSGVVAAGGSGLSVAPPAAGAGLGTVSITGAGSSVAPPAVSAGSSAGSTGAPVTPPERTYVVTAESRTVVVPAETRTVEA